MKNPRIYIENRSTAPKVIAGSQTNVYLILDGEPDERGLPTEERIDISNLVRSADVRLHVGEPIMANLEVFITGIETRAQIEDLLLREVKPRGGWRRRLRDITTFGSRLYSEYV